MSQIKTTVHNGSVTDFLNSVPDVRRREDAFKLLELFKKVTGLEPKMWGSSIVGFGSYHYKSQRSKQEGDWPLTGFSPRKQALTVYIMDGFGEYSGLLEKLGKHKTSVGCLYIPRLEDVDMKVLEVLIRRSFKVMKGR